VLAAYELLQRLHEKGMIDLLGGLLSAGETVVEHIVDVCPNPRPYRVRV
jgi:hypothetical protein